jgi:hypothetical protein
MQRERADEHQCPERIDNAHSAKITRRFTEKRTVLVQLRSCGVQRCNCFKTPIVDPTPVKIFGITFLALVLALTVRAELPPRYEITLEAFVDGPSTLRFTRTGFYWQNGSNAKPGRLGGRNDPTYVNGKEWIPKWRKPGSDRGRDTSEPFAWSIASTELQFEVESITAERGETGVEKRKGIEAKRQNGEFWITIPDPEPGARWYKLIIRAPDPLKIR